MTWIEVVTPTTPAAREQQSMAYDRARGRAVMFGGWGPGTLADDTWEYNAVLLVDGFESGDTSAWSSTVP
jgi:hypothetical protein